VNKTRQLCSLILLLVGLCLTGFVQAQALLSNLANPTDGPYGGGPDSANPFTTGSQPLDITSITVEWAASSGGVSRVGIYTNNAGVPSTTQVGGFFTNPNPTVVGNMVYTGSASLAANTTYWMVVDQVDDSEVAYTFTATFVAAPSTGGAVIPAGSAWGDNVAGTWNDDPASLKFSLNGGTGAAAAIPTLNEWGMLILIALLAVGAWGALRRR